jgi:hypothetical protein
MFRRIFSKTEFFQIIGDHKRCAKKIFIWIYKPFSILGLKGLFLDSKLKKSGLYLEKWAK